MAKIVDDSVLDAAMNKIKTATRMVVCSSQPANFAGIAAVNLAQVTMAGGDYTTANGDSSGRKVTMAAKNSVSVTATNTATHVSLDDGTTLLYVTTCASTALTSGNTVNISTWKIEIQDPT
jgi:hypothetical protein